jgi:hypothetical protein
MATPDDTLRALIRLIPPARALKEDLERSIHLEIYAGTGDLAIRSFNGLQASAAAITNDSYVATLVLTPSDTAGDKEKVSLALLAAGQLAAYLEGQTGLVSLGGGGSISYRMAPEIHIDGNSVPSDTINKMLDIGETALEGKRSN